MYRKSYLIWSAVIVVHSDPEWPRNRLSSPPSLSPPTTYGPCLAFFYREKSPAPFSLRSTRVESRRQTSTVEHNLICHHVLNVAIAIGVTAGDELPHRGGLPGRRGELPRRIRNRPEGGSADDRGEGGNKEGMCIVYVCACIYYTIGVMYLISRFDSIYQNIKLSMDGMEPASPVARQVSVCLLTGSISSVRVSPSAYS